MTSKVVNSIQFIGLLFFIMLISVSCDKEIDTVGTSLIDNNNFSTNTLLSDAVVANQNVDKVPSFQLSQYLLGVYSDPEFGKLKASIVSQIGLPVYGSNYNYGTNAAIDSVIVSIPYQVTQQDNYSDGKPQFKIDSVFGDPDTEFQLNIYELKTFLNTLDPTDPSKKATYYSDKIYQKGSQPLFSGNFKVNPSDTISIIKRYLADGITVFDKDTIQQTDKSPSINIPLDENLIKQLFVDNASGSEFSSNDDFLHYFRGLYLEAEELSNSQSHIVSLSLAKAKMIIYYSNDTDEDAETDLNGNGIKGEQGIRLGQSYSFLFGGVIANAFERDETNSHQSGEDRLYVQGAAGSIATIDILTDQNLTELQQNNWLITNATLTFYVDQNASSNIAPEQLFLYNAQDNVQLLDMLTEGINAVGGLLERDADGNPYKYVFKITDYISELLKTADQDPLSLIQLGLKVYNPTDAPTSVLDTYIKEFSWTPKGVVLYGAGQNAGDKKVQLEIFYAHQNN